MLYMFMRSNRRGKYGMKLLETGIGAINSNIGPINIFKAVLSKEMYHLDFVAVQ